MPSTAAIAIPLDEAPHVDRFPEALRRRLRDGFGCWLIWSATRERFRALKQGPAAVLNAIATHWQLNDEAQLSQATIGREARCSDDSVRVHVAELVGRQLLTTRRGRRRDGSEWIVYAPGASFLAELATWAEAPRAKLVARPQTGTIPRTSHPPRDFRGTPPRDFREEARSKDPVRSSSCAHEPAQEPAPIAPSSAEQEQGSIATAEDREIARAGVLARLSRAHPGLRPVVDAGELALALACVACVLGDADAKRAAVADALEGAWLRSEGAPRGSYVWRTVEHFGAHRALGRTARLSRERARPKPVPVEHVEILTPEETELAAAGFLAALGGA